MILLARDSGYLCFGHGFGRLVRRGFELGLRQFHIGVWCLDCNDCNCPFSIQDECGVGLLA